MLDPPTKGEGWGTGHDDGPSQETTGTSQRHEAVRCSVPAFNLAFGVACR